MRTDEPFSSDTIDDQIDHLASLPQSAAQSANARIVQRLSAHYEEAVDSTERVWERLSHYRDEYATSTQTVHEQRDTLDKASVIVFQQQNPQPRLHRYTPPSRFALVAAVMFAALLVSSLLWVLQIAHSTQVGYGLQATASSHGIYFSKSDGLYKLDLQTGKLLWHAPYLNQTQYNLLYEPVFIGNLVYLVEGDNSIVARNVADGKLRWSHTFSKAIAPGQTLLYASGGSLYFTSIDMSLASAPVHPEQAVVYELNPADGTIKAEYKPPRTGWVSPTVVDNMLYYQVGSNLYAEQLPTQKQLWQVPIGAPKGSQLQDMFIQNGVVYITVNVADSQTFIYAFDTLTGKMLWQSSQIPEDVKTWSITDTKIYAASYSGKIYAINAYDGKLGWQQSFDSSAMQATSDVLYLSYNIHGTGNHGFMALRAKDGAKLWQQSFVGLNDFSQLTLFNGVLYGLSTLNGSKAGESYVLYAFDAQKGSLIWKMPIDTGLIEIA